MSYFKFYLLLLLYFYLLFFIYIKQDIFGYYIIFWHQPIFKLSVSVVYFGEISQAKRYIIYCQWTVLCSMYEAQLFLNQATFCWSVSSICINNWTWCKICMRKSFIIACNSRSCEFILKLLDFTHKNSPNNGKWNCTLMLTKKPQTITF